VSSSIAGTTAAKPTTKPTTPTAPTRPNTNTEAPAHMVQRTTFPAIPAGDQAANTDEETEKQKRRRGGNGKRSESVDEKTARIIESDFQALAEYDDRDTDGKLTREALAKRMAILRLPENPNAPLKSATRLAFCEHVFLNKDKLTWEDLYVANAGQMDRPEDFETENYSTLFCRRDQNIAIFMWEAATRKFRYVIGKMEPALILERYAQLLTGIFEVAAEEERKAKARDERRSGAGEPSDINPLSALESARQKRGYSNVDDAANGLSASVGDGFPAGLTKAGTEGIRLPKPYAGGGMQRATVRQFMQRLGKEGFDNLEFLFKALCPDVARNVRKFYQKFEYLEKRLMPGWTLNFKLIAGSHVDQKNADISFGFVGGIFNGGDFCIPTLRLRLTAPGNTIIWGWTNKLEHYVAPWSKIEGIQSFRASFVFHYALFCADALSKIGADPFHSPKILLDAETFDPVSIIQHVLQCSERRAEKFITRNPGWNWGAGSPESEDKSEDDADNLPEFRQPATWMANYQSDDESTGCSESASDDDDSEPADSLDDALRQVVDKVTSSYLVPFMQITDAKYLGESGNEEKVSANWWRREAGPERRTANAIMSNIPQTSGFRVVYALLLRLIFRKTAMRALGGLIV